MCRKKRDAYRRMDEAVRRAMAPPPDLNDRILAACSRAETSPAPLLFAPRNLLRAAAVLAVAAAFVGLRVLQTTEGPQQTAEIDNTAETSQDSTVVADSAPERREYRMSPRRDNASGRTVTRNQVRLTDAGANTLSRKRAQPVTEDLDPIGSRVQHVWVVSDMERSRRLLLEGLPESAQCLGLTEDEQMMSYQLVVPDRDLQKLVNTLDRSGLSLVSPAAPQPQEKRAWGTPQKVMYTVSFVSSP